ncbi:MAG: alpha/beta fold hydrolase [Opitutales bacterium]
MIFALHGFLGCGSDFDPLKEALKSRIALYAPDLPGHGSRGGDREITLDSTLDTLKKIYEQQKPGPRILLGYSMGGRIALNWATHEPDRFDQIILISTSPGIQSVEARAARILQDQEWMTKLQSMERSDWLDTWERQPVFNTSTPIPQEVQTALRSQKLEADANGWIASMQGLGNGILPYLDHPFNTLNNPALLLSGEHDHKFRQFHHHLAQPKHVSNVSIPGAGHRPHLECPETTAQTIIDFILEA